MKMLVVATNPYQHVDHLGRPCACCPMDVHDPRYFSKAKHSADVSFVVGTSRSAPTGWRRADNPELVRRGGGRGAGAADPSPRYDITIEFRFAAFEIPETRFYLDRIREGALLPADEATAKAAKVRFVPVEQAREAARRRSGSDQPVQWIDSPPVPEPTAEQLDATANPQPIAEPDPISDPEPKIWSGPAKRRRGHGKTDDAGTDDES